MMESFSSYTKVRMHLLFVHSTRHWDIEHKRTISAISGRTEFKTWPLQLELTLTQSFRTFVSVCASLYFSRLHANEFRVRKRPSESPRSTEPQIYCAHESDLLLICLSGLFAFLDLSLLSSIGVANIDADDDRREEKCEGGQKFAIQFRSSRTSVLSRNPIEGRQGVLTGSL